MNIKLIKAQLTVTFLAVLRVLKRPWYLLLAALVTFSTTAFIVWTLNLSLARYVLFNAPLSVYDKFDFIFDGVIGVYTTYSSLQTVTMTLFSVLFGINIALLVYVVKNQGFNKVPKKAASGGLLFAVLGGGCIACGTSLIVPLFATVGAAGSPFIRDLSTIFNTIGIVLVGYSIFKLGAIVAYINASK